MFNVYFFPWTITISFSPITSLASVYFKVFSRLSDLPINGVISCLHLRQCSFHGSRRVVASNQCLTINSKPQKRRLSFLNRLFFVDECPFVRFSFWYKLCQSKKIKSYAVIIRASVVGLNLDLIFDLLCLSLTGPWQCCKVILVLMNCNQLCRGTFGNWNGCKGS